MSQNDRRVGAKLSAMWRQDKMSVTHTPRHSFDTTSQSNNAEQQRACTYGRERGELNGPSIAS